MGSPLPPPRGRAIAQETGDGPHGAVLCIRFVAANDVARHLERPTGALSGAGRGVGIGGGEADDTSALELVDELGDGDDGVAAHHRHTEHRLRGRADGGGEGGGTREEEAKVRGRGRGRGDKG